MPTNERETEIIMEHVFKNDENNENLKVALDIISRTHEIRERIIKPFLKELQVFICKKLDMSQLDMSQWDWKTELNYTSYGNISLSFGVSNQNKPVSILLQSYGKVIYIGVFSSPNPNIWSSMNHLSCKLNKKLGKVESSEWWIWYQHLRSPKDYTDWTKKDTLIKMHTKEAVKDVGNRFHEIIKVAKPEIEEWVQQNSPSQ